MKIDDLQKIKVSALWDTIKRLDGYINTINVRATLMTSACVAVFAGIITKWADLVNLQSHCIPKFIIEFLLVLASIFSFACCLYILRSIWPKFSSLGSTYHSLFYFGSIADNFTATSYREKIKNADIDIIEHDLSFQVHEISSILNFKFKYIKKAKFCLAIVFISCFLICLISLMGHYV